MTRRGSAQKRASGGFQFSEQCSVWSFSGHQAHNLEVAGPNPVPATSSDGQRILIPPLGGSIPPAPASHFGARLDFPTNANLPLWRELPELAFWLLPGALGVPLILHALY